MVINRNLNFILDCKFPNSLFQDNPIHLYKYHFGLLILTIDSLLKAFQLKASDYTLEVECCSPRVHYELEYACIENIVFLLLDFKACDKFAITILDN